MKNNEARIYADTRDMSRDEWLKARRGGIGGSDCAAIMGANAYVSPLSVYADKTGEAPEKETNEAMRQGNDFEAYVAERFTEETGIKLRRVNRILQHPDYPWMLANIDRDVVGGEGGFEAKTTNMLNGHDFEGGEVPLNYMWQCQHYMAVTGAPYWYLAILVLGKSFHVFRVDRDETLIVQLIEAEREFWNEHVLKGIPPLPTGTDADEDALDALYPVSDDTDESIDLSNVGDVLNLLELLKADKSVLERRIKEAEETVKLALGSCEKGNTERWRVSWKNSSRTSVDTKRLKAEMPEIAGKYMNVSNTRTFRISKVKEVG